MLEPEYKRIPLAQLVPPDTPARFEMSDEGMEDLVSSIKAGTILEPLLVVPWYQDHECQQVPTPDSALGEVGKVVSRYEIRAGHRRFTAAGIAQLHDVPCMVFENTEESRYYIMLHENVVREELTPVEEGFLFVELANKHEWSMEDLQRRFKRSENYINERVDLVKCDPRVTQAVQSRAINLGQAKQILRAKDEPFRLYLLDQAVTHGANIRTLHQMVFNQSQQEATAQGALHLNTPELATQPVVEEPPACVWCKEGVEPQHLRQVWVHWYHQKDLMAVIEQFGVHNLHKPAVAQGK
jgi:ParB family chromosome partitioning protein